MLLSSLCLNLIKLDSSPFEAVALSVKCMIVMFVSGSKCRPSSSVFAGFHEHDNQRALGSHLYSFAHINTHMSAYDSAAAESKLHQYPTMDQCLVLCSVCVTSQKQQFAGRKWTKDLFKKKKAFDSGGGGGVTQKQRDNDGSLSSSLQKIGLLLEAIVTKTCRAEWKTDSLQSSSVVFCLRSAHAPIIPAPLNRWTPFNPFQLCLFLYLLCISFCVCFQVTEKHKRMKSATA